MKRLLVILRHAKSSWSSDAPDDHSRPLNKRGRRDAPRVGAHLEANGWLPSRVISSDSMRTRLTVSGLYSNVETDPEVTFTRKLYHAGLAEIRREVESLDAAVESVAVVGHNPGWEAAVERLSGEPHRFTTCNAAIFESQSETDNWSEAFEGQWNLVDLIQPREIS